MKSENLIHIRLEPDEAVRAKRGMLSTELSMVKIAHFIRAYKDLRMRELELKEELDKKIQELKKTERTLKGFLPKLKVPKILEIKEEKPVKEIKTPEPKAKKDKSKSKKESPIHREKAPKKPHVDSIEAQLSEIQSRLSQLG